MDVFLEIVCLLILLLDKEQLKNYSRCLGLNVKIGEKTNGSGTKSWRIQLKNRLFYDFLLFVGLTPKKSLTLGGLKIPDRYFFDFLRGCFDGDGCSYSYWDTRWRSSFMFYIGFASGSKNFLSWLREELKARLNVKGHITSSKRSNTYYQLKYAKKESLAIIKEMYYNPNAVCLSRKYKKILNTLSIEEQQQKVYLTK